MTPQPITPPIASSPSDHLHPFKDIMSDNITVDKAKLKQGLVKVAECVAAISSAAAVINPIFGVVGSAIRVVVKFVDDEDINKLKSGFDSVNKTLLDITQQNYAILEQIKIDLQDMQYSKAEDGLNNQYQAFMEMVEAPPEQYERKKKDFLKTYEKHFYDQHLNTLYNAVMGTQQVFSRPFFEVYLGHSNRERRIMEQLCTRLTHLFCIGLITLMGRAAIEKRDEEGLKKEWEEKMKHVQEKMQEALQMCE